MARATLAPLLTTHNGQGWLKRSGRMVRMKFPTQEQGHEAHLRGQGDALAGRDRDAGPWDCRSTDDVERCLAGCYQRGYGYGIQLALQRRFGDSPTA